MKKYVKAATHALPFPKSGSAPDANKRGGKLKVGSYSVVMDNGGVFQPVTAKTLFDQATGEVTTSLSIVIKLAREYSEPGYHTSDVLVEFFSYTSEECQKLYKAVSAMSEDELYEFLSAYEAASQARYRLNSVDDEYEGKIDDEGYWLE